MKKNIFLYPALFIVGAFLACKKDSPAPPTIITGTVTNKTTGEPVVGAYIDCSIWKEEWPSPQAQNHSTYSDSDGNYRLEIPQEFRFSFSAVYYVGKFLTFVDPVGTSKILLGETNVIDVALIPRDGFLRLKMNNSISQNDSLYVMFFSPTMAAKPYLGGALTPSNLPYKLNFGSSAEEVFALPSEEFVGVYWGPKMFMPLMNSPFRDSIYLFRNDTVDFTIHF